MSAKNSFKLGLLISAGAHFCLIILFPMWEPSPPKKPEITQVALIKMERKQLKSKKAPVPSPEPTPQAKQQQSPKLSPVEVAVKTSRKIPVLTPRAKAESKLEVPFPTLPFKLAVSPRGKNTGAERKKGSKKPLQSPSTDTKLPPKISSPVQEEIPPSLTPSPGTGEGEAAVPSAKRPVGITFKGLGPRKPERIIQPTYPPEMEKKGMEGEGKVKIYVAPAGQVVDVEIIRTSGWHAFDEEICSALLRWKFTPVDERGTKTYEGNFYFRFVK